MADAYKLVMWGFHFLGWALSMSKFDIEGKRKAHGIILGHEIDLVFKTRGVTEDKKARVRQHGTPMLTAVTWSRTLTQKLVGLLQAIKDDVIRRWRLAPMYAVVYADGMGDRAYPSPRARECLRKVLATLDERRSLFHRPTRWEMPAGPLVELVPNGDASSKVGYGGCLLIGKEMQYFRGKWTPELLARGVHISLLEAWTTVMMAFTWGHLWSGKKVVVRTDSKHGCACLNKLWSNTESMAVLCDLWEDVQFYFGFEALVVFCKGKSNRWADAVSRVQRGKLEAVLRTKSDDAGLPDITFKEVNVIWSHGTLQCAVGSHLQ